MLETDISGRNYKRCYQLLRIYYEFEKSQILSSRKVKESKVKESKVNLL